MTKQLLFAEGDYRIWKEQGISPEAFSFLDDMRWGNEGAVYEHKNTKEHIQLIPNPTLLSVTENDKIRITAVFCNTPVSILIPQAKKGYQQKTPVTITFQGFTSLSVIHLSK
jgi:hypothetical protein